MTIYLGNASPALGGQGGGSIAIDQSFNPTSPNAQSGTAVAEAISTKQDTLVSGTNIKTVAGNSLLGSGNIAALVNTATGQDSTTIDGSPTASSSALNIGAASRAQDDYATAVGNGAYGDGEYGTAVGANAEAGGTSSTAIGSSAVASNTHSIQIGEGTNSTTNTLSVGFGQTGNYTLLTGAGKIPVARLDAFTGATAQAAGSAGAVPAPAAADVDKFLKGDGTWATAGGGGGGGIQNTATGNYSLTILGNPSSYDNSINIGEFSYVNDDYSIAIGGNDDSGTSAGSHSVSIGYSSYSSDYACSINGTAADYSVGILGSASDEYSVAIGRSSSADYGCTAIGTGAQSYYPYSIALGYSAQVENACEFVVGGKDNESDGSDVSYKMLDLTTGKIPNDRINGVSGSFTTADGKTVTVTNGVITNIV